MVRIVAAHVVLDRAERLRARLANVQGVDDAGRAHRARIAAKYLRYLLEAEELGSRFRFATIAARRRRREVRAFNAPKRSWREERAAGFFGDVSALSDVLQ